VLATLDAADGRSTRLHARRELFLAADGLSRAVEAMARHLAPSGVLIVGPWLSPSTIDPNFMRRVGLVQRLDAVRRVIAAMALNDGFDWLSGAIGQAYDDLTTNRSCNPRSSVGVSVRQEGGQ